jgi:hypothetical protein
MATKRVPINRPSARNDYPPPWESRPVELERWYRHRDRMMAAVGAGHRPIEWWKYETEATRPRDSGEATIALFEMGEFTEAELAELMPKWRERYEQANDPEYPNFSYLAAGGVRLTGLEAKQAFYRWAGIPPEVVRKWDAERDAQSNTRPAQ